MTGAARRAISIVAAATAVALLAGACGGSDSAASCRPEERPPIGSSTHVLPGVDVTYDQSPPTSGPHQIPAPDAGVSETPISEPRQVAALESGLVIVQFAESLPLDDQGRLAALARDGVIVAPAERTLDGGASVAFTAWGVRRLCDQISVGDAEAFIDAHLGDSLAEHRGS